MTAAVLASAGPATPAGAADGQGDIPSVAVQPAEPKKGDPNGGQWFVLSLPPGGSGVVKAKVINPAKVQQTVTFSLRDLTFADDGTPSVAPAGPQRDVGAWGRPARPSVELPALSTVIVPFTVSVPSDAEPGDHVGVVVASTANLQGKFRVVRQVATRFYITVSGEASRAYSIVSVTPVRNSRWWPSKVDADVVLRNDGRTRLRPRVTVGGHPADGSRLLLSRSVEKYRASLSVPWYGGPVDLSVRAVTDDGSVRTANRSIFIVPWGLLVAIAVGLATLFLLVKLVLRRRRRLSGMRADLERLERLVARQQSAEPAVTVETTDEEETVAALLTALKRAQRSGGAPATMSRLSLALHDAGGPAIPWLVDALRSADAKNREELLAALRTADRAAVEAELRRADLPQDVRDVVLLPTAKPRATKRTSTRTGPAAASRSRSTTTTTQPAPRPPKPRASKD